MIQAPRLENEHDRLSDLYSLNLLDTFKEERFERLIRLAKNAMGASICYLALLDEDRQWFKSKCGLASDETGREISFCGHTIAQDGLMVVPDATRDPRFADNPMVTGAPHIRFYAGYPMKGPEGHNVGTFCVADTAPRTLSGDEQQLMVDYAMMAQRELSLLGVIETQNSLLETQTELEKVRRSLQRELRDAADFVHQKLPRRFDNELLALDWAFIESSQLGGDMFGLEKLAEDRYLIYLLDVAGHGIGASLLAVSVQNTLRQMLGDMQGAISPARLLEDLNAAFQMDANQNRFFTMWCGVVDLSRRTLAYANGGNLPPVLFDIDLNVTRLEQNGLMVGIVADARYTNEQVGYTPGTRLVLFSDGIVEELDKDGNQFGRERLESSYISRCLDCGCGLDSILDGVRRWNGGHPMSDDISLVELTLK